MDGLLSKATRLGVAAVMVVLAVAVSGSFAQRKMSPGSNLCVSKNSEDAEGSCYTTVQAAVNAAKKGQVIEILDESTYREQVTIDGRATSPWTGVTGGKDGITLRYVPAAGAAATWNHTRPTILYRDITNTHPKSQNEARQDNELTGAGNFETCGALRVLRAKGVTIEGIAVDGGGPFAFGQDNTWCNAQGGDCSPLFHGNAAITLAVAGQVTIRDCDLKNAYFGINVKDRNTGGVFGNPNKADRDSTIPLSNFGMVGGHLFEYNKINTNVVGLFFESAWDLGSTVRYNLIYGNKIANQPSITSLPEPNNQNAGAFMFKDMYLSPIAIYNNTLYDNSGNFCGHWQAGGQHLVFNNIFSKSRPSENKGNDHMAMDGKFPFRMYHCVFSTDSSYLQLQQQGNYCSSNPETPGGRFVADLRFQGTGFAHPTRTRVQVSTCNNGNTPSGQTQGQDMVLPGAKIPGLGDQMVTAADSFFSDANIRWLQTEGLGGAWSELLPSLFKSLSPTNENFLVPDWDKKAVQDFIKNKGWPAAGIRNNDGNIADLGAIPSTGVRQTTVARILPNAVVLLSANGANATANFKLIENRGTIGGSPKIKLLRWIAPIPTNTLENAGVASTTNPTGGNWPSRMRPVAKDAVTAIANTSALKVGNNTFSFTTGKSSVPTYGFFEVIAEGTDANSKAVHSDVGFLPYRKLDYVFELVVTAPNGTAALKTVTAGEPYKLTVTAKKVGESGNYTGVIPEVTYSLLSDPTAFMYYTSGANKDKELVIDKNKAYPQSYEIYFTHATNAETIFAAGAITLPGQSNGAPINGTLDLVVRPGKAEKVVFIDPISLKQLGNGTAPPIYRGAEQDVTVEVRDKFDNAIDSAGVTVTISSSDETIGVAGRRGAIATKTATTNNKGVAAFAAKADDKATTGAWFDMTATIAGVPAQTDKDNVGRLRVAKSNDRLEVFYSGDSALAADKKTYNVDYSVIIDKNVGEYDVIKVRVVNGDTVKTTGSAGKFVMVKSEADLVFSATPGGTGTPATVFPLTNGVAIFYVDARNAKADIIDAGIVVTATNDAAGSERYAAIQLGSRDGINFKVKSASISHAVVYGDGQGRPDSLRIVYQNTSPPLSGSGAMPSKVDLEWGGAVLSASGTSLAARGDYVLWVDLRGAATRPTGYTYIETGKKGIVIVHGGPSGADAEEKNFVVYDGVGPVLGNGASGDGAGGGPLINERIAADANDVITVTVSEQISEKPKTILYVAGTVGNTTPPTAAGTPVAVISATTSDNRTFTLTVGNAAGLKAGYWVRLDPSGADAVTDNAPAQPDNVGGKNKPHPDNRWVQLRLSEKNPEVLNAWYEGDDATGKPVFAFVEFDKPIDLDVWFAGGNGGNGGSVKFADDGDTKQVNAANLGDFFQKDGDNTLKITLSKAAPKIASSGPIRTSGVMRFTLGYSASVTWEAKTVDDLAKDKAAPVLAKPATLRTGAIKSDGNSFEKDTLIVYYSEDINDNSKMATLKDPLVIKLADGTPITPSLTYVSCTYVLAGDEAGYYKAVYVMDNEITLSGKGDSVHIVPYKIGDKMEVANEQTNANNKWQPLNIDPSVAWTITVRNNPLISGGPGKEFEVIMSPNIKSSDNMEVTAYIRVFDNLGSLVLYEEVKNEDNSDKIKWQWYGQNSKGRLVGTGTYLFKATCEYKKGGKVEEQHKFSKYLGVVRGKK